MLDLRINHASPISIPHDYQEAIQKTSSLNIDSKLMEPITSSVVLKHIQYVPKIELSHMGPRLCCPISCVCVCVCVCGGVMNGSVWFCEGSEAGAGVGVGGGISSVCPTVWLSQGS